MRISDFVIQLRQFFGLFLIFALEKHVVCHTDVSALVAIGQYIHQSIRYRLTKEDNFVPFFAS